MTASSLFSNDDSPVNSPSEFLGTALSPPPPTGSAPASLYRKYRPQTFHAEEFVGQEHVVRTLRNAILLDRVAHAYLFSGPRGTGKTTTARLLAKAINCLDPDRANRPCNVCANCVAINTGAAPDVIEIDAASNRGIDDIRDLRDRVRYAPTSLPAKVYIIDEAHQITGAAANAFLKTLEEPPSHSHFILATTDPEELLPTIVSRCQRFEFRRIAVEEMTQRLRRVAEEEGITVDPDALGLIARHATGSLRDALGLLDQLALQAQSTADSESLRSISTAEVQAALGLSRNDRVESLVTALARRSPGDALRVIQDAVDAGEDPRQLNRQLLAYLRTLLYERSGGSPDADDRARALAAEFTLEELAAHARRFSEIDFSIRHSPFPQLPLEVALVEAMARDSGQSYGRQNGAQPQPDTVDQPAAGSPRPTSLRDRVRGTAAAVEPRSTERLAVVQPSPGTITPIRPVEPAPPAPVPHADPDNPSAISVGRIADMWPAIRADVKAVNRRIEALLSEVDPVAVAGNQVTLAVPYPFHRDKLNSDDVRDTIAGVLSRQLGRTVSISCVLRGEVVLPPAAPESLPPSSPAPATPSEPSLADGQEDEERILARLQAAKNIFDAEEIDPIAFGEPPEQGGS
jgi:DNA polymerase III subunit gamma/tau